MPTLPLDGVRVLATEHFLSGPMGSMLLADWGAEVIRIERRGKGEAWRDVNVTRDDENATVAPLGFLTRNRNKKSITLDLSSPRGRDIYLGMVEKADVVLENLAPDAMRKLHLDYQNLRKVNPAIIYATVSGFGHDDVRPSEYTSRPAFDFVTQAMSGLMWLPSFGKQPNWLGFTLTDLVPGIMLATGVLLALRQRDRTGEGQRVDISMYDVAALLNEKNLSLQAAVGRTPSSPHDLQLTNQLGLFRATDGYVAIGVVSDALWPSFCTLIGRPDLAGNPDLASLQQRTDRLDSIISPAVRPWIEQFKRIEVVDKLLSIGVPVGPVQTAAEVIQCPVLRARGMVVEMDTDYGRITSIGNPVSLGGEPLAVRRPPRIGEHTDEVLKALLGVSDDVLAELRRDNVI